MKNSELSEDSKSNSGCIPQVAEEIKHVNKLYTLIYYIYITFLYLNMHTFLKVLYDFTVFGTSTNDDF